MLSYGADPKLKTEGGQTAEEIAPVITEIAEQLAQEAAATNRAPSLNW